MRHSSMDPQVSSNSDTIQCIAMQCNAIQYNIIQYRVCLTNLISVTKFFKPAEQFLNSLHLWSEERKALELWYFCLEWRERKRVIFIERKGKESLSKGFRHMQRKRRKRRRLTLKLHCELWSPLVNVLINRETFMCVQFNPMQIERRLK